MRKDTVQIDGVDYRKVGRKAEVGDKIIIVNPIFAGKMRGYFPGEIFDVTGTLFKSVETDVLTPCKTDKLRFWHEEYYVLEPIEKDSESDRDHIIALSREVAQLKRKLSDLESQVNTKTSISQLGDSLTTISNAQDSLYNVVARHTEEIDAMKVEVSNTHSNLGVLDERTRPLADGGLESLAGEIVNVIARRLERSERL